MMVAMVLGTLLVGCGGDDCVSLCTEAQAGNCTAITGSCGNFCSALDDVQGPAGCKAQRDAYEDCLTDEDGVCSNSCNGPEAALANCIGAYCLANSGNASCQVLIQSF